MTEFLAGRDALNELLKSTENAAAEVDKYIEKQREKTLKDIEKTKENELKERVRLEKAALKQADSQAKKAAKLEGTQPISTEGMSAFWDATGTSVNEIPTFDSDKDFDADKNHDRFSDLPCMLKICEPVAKIMDDKELKGANGISHVQFSCSTQAKNDKRGQQPLITSRNDKIRETMCSYGPSMLKVGTSSGGMDKSAIALKQFMQSVSSFGFLPGCVVHGELERYGLPSIRYQLRGSREVVIFPYTHLRQFYPLKEACDASKKDLCETIKDLLLLANPDMIKKYFDAGGVIYRGEVADFDCMIVLYSLYYIIYVFYGFI